MAVKRAPPSTDCHQEHDNQKVNAYRSNTSSSSPFKKTFLAFNCDIKSWNVTLLLRQELDLFADLRPLPEGGHSGLVDEGHVGGERVEDNDGRCCHREIPQAVVPLDHHVGAYECDCSFRPARDQVIIVHEHLLARVRRGYQNRPTAEHEGFAQPRLAEPAI